MRTANLHRVALTLEIDRPSPDTGASSWPASGAAPVPQGSCLLAAGTGSKLGNAFIKVSLASSTHSVHEVIGVLL